MFHLLFHSRANWHFIKWKNASFVWRIVHHSYTRCYSILCNNHVFVCYSHSNFFIRTVEKLCDAFYSNMDHSSSVKISCNEKSTESLLPTSTRWQVSYRWIKFKPQKPPLIPSQDCLYYVIVRGRGFLHGLWCDFRKVIWIFRRWERIPTEIPISLVHLCVKLYVYI